MDECVRLEEALQAEESRNAQEQSPRRRSGRRSFKWPFSLDDYGRTDEYRLPPVSTRLAAFSPGPAEASPHKRGKSPSSPRISHRSDSRNDLLRRATRSPQRRDDPTVERVSSRTEPKPRVERRASYIAPSISQHRDNLSQATPQSSAPLRSVTYTDLQRLRDNEDPRRHQSLPRTFQPRTYIEEDQDRDRLTDVENAVPSSERAMILYVGNHGFNYDGDRTTRAVSEPEPLEIEKIVDILRDPATAGNVIQNFCTMPNGITFTAACKACAPVKLNTAPPQHKSLVMMEIATKFPLSMDMHLYEVKTRFSHTADSTIPEPKIAKRAEYPPNEGDSKTGGEKKPDIVNKGDADELTLTRRGFKGLQIVIHVALLLEQDQRELTESFDAGFWFHISGVDEHGIVTQRMFGPKEDIVLRFELKVLQANRKLLVSKDLDFDQLLESWVKSERSVGTYK